MNDFINDITAIVSQTQSNLPYLFFALGIMWGMYLLTKLLGNRLYILGILPRHPLGLIGIFFAPFLHGDFNHLFFNSVPFFILSAFLMISGLSFYLTVSLYLIILSGLLTWTFGRKAIHIGASAVITGYWSFLVMNAYEQGGFIATSLAIICVYYFAGIFFGIFPSKKGVSWEGHLFGLLAGIIIKLCLPWLPSVDFLF
jgi:membrane associated rhomboid family serine protease